MNSITSSGRIAILFTLAIMFAMALCPRLLALDDHNPIGATGAFEGVITTGCAYNVLNHNATRQIDDIVVPGAIGKYGLKMTRYYNSRRTTTYSSLMGVGWTPEYFWITYNGKTEYPNGNVWDNSCTGEWGLPGPLGVSDWPTTWNGYPAFRLADGGTVVFSDAVWMSVATKIIDPYGQITTITLDTNSGEITRVTEPGGRYLQFTYDGTLHLTRVDAYDGLGHQVDWVVYHYTAISPGNGHPLVSCLTSVDYSDGTHAYYTYEQDNVPEDPDGGSAKLFPLVNGCNDVRYHGPMRRIAYDYQDQGPHGAIVNERYWDGVGGHEGTGVTVSSIGPPLVDPRETLPNFPTTFTETRDDGPSRTFIYSDLHLHRFNEDTCPTLTFGDTVPQQFLQSYTDFQGHTTYLDYDSNSYVSSVQDARGNTTAYARASPPPTSIGQITKITHPDGTHIDYTYQSEPGAIGGHYVATVSDERQDVTVYTRDPNTHLVTRIDYKNAVGAVLAYETFSYNPFGQVQTRRLKNGANEYFAYDGRGLLTDKYNPKFDSVPGGADPRTHYDYYTSADGKLGWIDRVKKVTLPPNYPSSYQATETYEYETDVNGNPVAGRGLVTKITHADGTFQSFSYDSYGNKLWEENEMRKHTSYAYDSYNRLTSTTNPLQKSETFSYLKPGSISSYLHTADSVYTYTSRAGIVTTNGYDENFRKTSSTVAGQSTWFHYDAIGNQDYVTDPRGGAGDANYTTYTDYDNRNRKWQVREPLGRTTQFYYDDHINLTRIIRPDNTTETKAYDGMNRLVTDTVPKATGINIVTQFQYYGAEGHSASLLQKTIDGENHTCQFEYDPSGLKTKTIYPDLSTQQWSYDDAHNMKTHTTVAGEIHNFGYDIRNRKIGEWWDGWPADAEWRAFGYDDASHLTLATNGIGTYWTNFIADVRRFYDDAGRLSSDQQTVYVNGIGNTKTVNYPIYDNDGRLTRMYVSGVSPAYDYTFSYDAMGRFESIKPTGGALLFQYSYDAASNETQRYNWANHIAQNYVPDRLNRMTSVEVKNTTTNTQLGLETYDYDSASRLHTVTREDNKQDSFTYYLDGELNVASYGAAPTPPPTPTPPPGSPTPTPTPPGQIVTPTFNPDGTDYSACAFSYTFNVIISSATTGALIRYTTDGSNPTPTYGTPLANGGTASFTVPSLHTTTLKAIAYVGGTGSSVKSADYSFERDCGQRPMAYPLDMAGIRSNHGPMAPDVTTLTYTLDKAGNRTSVNATTYSPNNINQYTSVGGNAVTNGNDHEIKLYGGFTYYYMRDQELTKVTATGFTYDLGYDALGRCVRRIFNNDPAYTTYYIYDGDKPILEYRLNGQIARNLYGKGVDEILMRTDPAVNGGQAFYFQQDHEGSTTHLTNLNNGSGQIIERYRYDAFGAPSIYAPDWTVRTGSSYGNRFLFTGREYDGAWVYEYRARLYHSGLGRFMSEDPKLFDASDYNLFRYCHNDPIDFTDAMGTELTLPPGPNHATPEMIAGQRVDITIAERISLWQKSMESSIGGELALNAVRITDALSRQLGQGSFRDQHIEFRPTGKTATSTSGNPITQGKVIYYVNGEPVAVYPANSGGFKSKDSLVIGNDTRTPAGHYLGTNFHERYDKPGMVREGVGFSLDLNPLFYTNRTLLRMHPDGRDPGSEGCAALSSGASGLRDFQGHVSGYLSHSPFIDVYVGY